MYGVDVMMRASFNTRMTKGDGSMFDEETTTVEADGLTACCHALTTFHDMMECCKGCWREVINAAPPAAIIVLPPGGTDD